MLPARAGRWLPSVVLALACLVHEVPRCAADPPQVDPEDAEVEAADPPDTKAPPAHVDRNVRYATIEGVNPELLSLDVYAPSEGEGRPVMVMVHGGGWRKGDKAKGAINKARHFVDLGWIYVTVNYRLSPAVLHPAHVEDVAAAIAFVHRNVAKWGGDPGRIHVMGHSAGAHLAALVAVDERRLKAHGLGLDVVRGVVLLDGAGYDIAELLREPREMQKALYEGAFGRTPEGWMDASPIAHVAADKGIAPFLILPIASREDSRAQSEALAKALRDAGVRAEVHPAPGKTHGTINSEFGAAGDAPTKWAMEFLGSLEER